MRTRIGRPMRPRAQLMSRRGPRILYLSPAQATAYMNAAATKYGGVERHWAWAIVMFMLPLRMMGRKNESAEAMVVQQLKNGRSVLIHRHNSDNFLKLTINRAQTPRS